MAISEQARHQMYQRIEEVLGPDAAATLMEHLPPVGWADVGTKRDLDALEERMSLRFAATKRDLDALEERMSLRFAATKRDLDALEERMALRFATTKRELDALEERMSLRFATTKRDLDVLEERVLRTLHQELAAHTRAITMAMVTAISGSMIAVAGLAFAAARLT